MLLDNYYYYFDIKNIVHQNEKFIATSFQIFFTRNSQWEGKRWPTASWAKKQRSILFLKQKLHWIFLEEMKELY